MRHRFRILVPAAEDKVPGSARRRYRPGAAARALRRDTAHPAGLRNGDDDRARANVAVAEESTQLDSRPVASLVEGPTGVTRYRLEDAERTLVALSPCPTEPGWVPSPGRWTAPERARAGKDWFPSGGAIERLDRMPWWVRAWSRSPLRALGRFEDRLWDHGGYDVEGPEATAERERMNARDEAFDSMLEAALYADGPWPAARTVRTQDVEVIDVDRYDDLAVVTAAIADDSTGDGPLLVESVFRWEKGRWRSLGGWGSGSGSDPLLERQKWGDPEHSLQIIGLGSNSPGGKERRRVVCHATVLCAPAVNSVTVERPTSHRRADVSEGPGWIGIIWPQGSEPRVTALDAASEQIGVLRPEEFRDSAPRHRGLFEGRFWWRAGRGTPGWFNSAPRKRRGARIKSSPESLE